MTQAGNNFETTRCFPDHGWCDYPSGDCRTCSRLKVQPSKWVCAFCVVGRRSDGEPDKIISGAYTSGRCYRCNVERIVLLGLV